MTCNKDHYHEGVDYRGAVDPKRLHNDISENSTNNNVVFE